MNTDEHNFCSYRSYVHPGHVFLSQYGPPQSRDDITAYAQFLLRESGIEHKTPTNLSIIYNRFGIPIPRRLSLPHQQGILVDSSEGVIIINEDDPIVRQRFTEGHELTELLFAAIEEQGHAHSIPCWMWEKKEQLCDHGSAELLMPRPSFCAKLEDLEVSISTAQLLTSIYET